MLETKVLELGGLHTFTAWVEARGGKVGAFSLTKDIVQITVVGRRPVNVKFKDRVAYSPSALKFTVVYKPRLISPIKQRAPATLAELARV